MTAIGFGLVAAFLWGTSAVVGTRLVRLVGAWVSIGTTVLVGVVLVLPLAVVVERPDAPLASWAYAGVSGVCYLAAVACWLLAVRAGKVSVVTAIVSTDGAMAALIAVAGYGETMHAGIAVALAVIVAGVVTAGVRRGVEDGVHFTARELSLALAAAGLFGFSFVASGEAQEGLGVVWTLATSRFAAVAVLAPALLVLGGLRLPRGAVPFAIGMAALDLAGFAAFLVGVSASVAITAVIASQYAIVAAVGGFLAFGERLSRLQTTGVGLTLAGVAALAALRATSPG